MTNRTCCVATARYHRSLRKGTASARQPDFIGDTHPPTPGFTTVPGSGYPPTTSPTLAIVPAKSGGTTVGGRKSNTIFDGELSVTGAHRKSIPVRLVRFHFSESPTAGSLMLFWAIMVVVVVAIVLVVVGRSGNDPESVMARLPVRDRQRLAWEFAQIERGEDLEPDAPGSPWGSLIDRMSDDRLRARWVFSAPEACSRVRVGGHYRCEHVEVRVAEIESTGERDDKGWYLVVAVVEPV